MIVYQPYLSLRLESGDLHSASFLLFRPSFLHVTWGSGLRGPARLTCILACQYNMVLLCNALHSQPFAVSYGGEIESHVHAVSLFRNSATTAMYLSGISMLVQWAEFGKVYHLTRGIPVK